MDTPDASAPVPDVPGWHVDSQPTAAPGHVDDQGPDPTAPIALGDHGPEPTAPIALGPVSGSAPPPPPPAPLFGPAPAGPDGGAWGPVSTPYGLVWGPLPTPSPASSRRHPRLIPAICLAVVASLLVGVGVGYALRRPATSPTNIADNSGGRGSFTAPSGGGSGSTTPPSGSGSSGSPVPSSVVSTVDRGLVDINVTLSYQQESAAGTGQVLTSSGLVLTNNHVIDGATSISAVDIGNGRTYSATVVGYDRTGDLAVIQLHGASGLSTVSIGDSSKVTVGQPIVAIGNAGGVGGTPSVAAGAVTTLNQAITASDNDGSNPEQLTGLIEVNANVQPGDSGGPLVDSAGDVIGIDTAASASPSLSSTGDGYAIPINQAITIARQIESGKGSAAVHIGPTAFLGVVVESSAAGGFGGLGQGGSSVSGATVAEVAPGSPAEGAGLVTGDVITSAGGQTVSSPASLSAVIASHRPGDSIPVGWTDSAGTQHTVNVQLASGPAT